MRLKKYNKMFFIIAIFSSIIFTFSIVSSILISDYKISKEGNYMPNKLTKYLTFTLVNNSSKKTIKINELINILEQYDDDEIYMEYDPIPKYLSDSTLFGKGIYYNYNTNTNFPILEGRDLNIKDMKTEDKKILVGKNLVSHIVRKDDKGYFLIEGEEFEVIGILGNRENKSGYDDTFITNLNSTNKNLDSRAIWKLDIGNSEVIDRILNEYKMIATNNEFNINITDENYREPNINDIISKNREFMNIFILVFIVGIMNLIIVVSYWINKSIKEIGIRKAYGATNLNISLHILKQYELSILVSVLFGVIIHLIFRPILKSIFPIYTFYIHYQNIILITIIFMGIGLITAIIPLIKLIKVQPVIIMKGRKNE